MGGLPAPFDIGRHLTTLVRFLFVRGHTARALPHYRKLREVRDRLGEDERAALQAMMGIPGGIYAMLRAVDQRGAETFLRCKLRAMEQILPPGHEELLQLQYFVGNVYRMMGRHEDALDAFRSHLAAVRAGPSRDDASIADVMERVLDELLQLGRAAEAERLAGEIERLTGRRPICDAMLNQIRRELGSVW